jgi:hypothetical protein
MRPQTLPPHQPETAPESRHLAPPPTFLFPVAATDTALPRELLIRRYAMHWLQHAAARVHRRTEHNHRHNQFVISVLGIDHLFDTSDIPNQPLAPRRARSRAV